jgi:hypothetical protein
MANLEKVYYYRVVLKASDNFDDYLIDKYQVYGKELWKGLAELLKDYMKTYPARANWSEGFYLASARYYEVYFSMSKLERPGEAPGTGNINSRLDDIDNLIENSLTNSVSSYTERVIPKPPKFKMVRTSGSSFEDTSNIYFESGGASEITITFSGDDPAPKESYIVDTTPYRKRGLVKIQGEEQYREVGQIIGKDLVGNPTTVASDNQTHVSASETDEQVENSIAVSIWYFKNKTTQNFDTFENKSSIPSSNYKNEYQRIKGILG